MFYRTYLYSIELIHKYRIMNVSLGGISNGDASISLISIAEIMIFRDFWTISLSSKDNILRLSPIYREVYLEFPLKDVYRKP